MRLIKLTRILSAVGGLGPPKTTQMSIRPESIAGFGDGFVTLNSGNEIIVIERAFQIEAAIVNS